MTSRFELRARDAVASCLIRRLVVPRVYFEVPWPDVGSPRYDVVAIDRDGKGDTHLVEIRERASDALNAVGPLFGVHAAHRWIAYLRGTEGEETKLALQSMEGLYPEASAGRIGVIEVVEMAGGVLGANVMIASERFPGAFYDLSVEFSGSHKADREY